MRAKASPADDEQRLALRVTEGMLAADAFSRWLGLELVRVAPRTATVRMTVRADMLNGFGVCHGGVTFSLADSALAFASNTHGRVTMSIENAIGYPASAREGDVLTAHAAEESANGPLAFYRVDVTTPDGKAVAHFRGTVYRTKRAHASAEGLLTSGEEWNG